MCADKTVGEKVRNPFFKGEILFHGSLGFYSLGEIVYRIFEQLVVLSLQASEFIRKSVEANVEKLPAYQGVRKEQLGV